MRAMVAWRLLAEEAKKRLRPTNSLLSSVVEILVRSLSRLSMLTAKALSASALAASGAFSVAAAGSRTR